MCLIRNWLSVFFLAAFSAAGADAHDPLQTTIEVQATADGLEISAILSPASAAALLKTSDLVNKATFASKRAELADAAPKLCTLRNAAGESLPPSRTVASLNPDGEVCILLQYNATTSPDSLRADFLTTVSSGYFVGLTDRRFTPARHGVLFRSRDSYSFAEAATEEAKQQKASASNASASVPKPAQNLISTTVPSQSPSPSSTSSRP